MLVLSSVYNELSINFVNRDNLMVGERLRFVCTSCEKFL